METDIKRTIACDGFFAYSIPTAYWNGNLDPFFPSSRDLTGRKNISHTLLSLPLKSNVNFQKEVFVFSFLRPEQIWQIVSLIHIYTSTLIFKSLAHFRRWIRIRVQDPDWCPNRKFLEVLLVSRDQRYFLEALGKGTFIKENQGTILHSYIRCTSPQNRFPNRFDTCFQCSLQTLGLNHCFRWATYNGRLVFFFQCCGSVPGRIRDFSARWYSDSKQL